MERILEQQMQLMSGMQQQLAILQAQVLKLNEPKEAKEDTIKSNVSVPWPQPLEVGAGDPFENLEFFRTRWENYCVATGMNKWPPEKEEAKAGILLTAIGNAAMKKYMEFNLTEEQKKDSSLIFTKIQEEIIKKTNIIYSRYLFNIRHQTPEESFDDFVLALRKLIKPCNYPETLKDELLRDRIVVGIRDTKVMTELLRKEDLLLDSAINTCRAAERATVQVAALQKEEHVNKIIKSRNDNVNDLPRKCKFCGESHVFKKKVCPAWGQRCEECGGRNHLKRVCKKKGATVKEIEKDYSSDDSEVVFISEVRTNKNTGQTEAPLLFKMDNNQLWKKVYCTLDTGAQVSVMGLNYYKSLTGKCDLSDLSPSTQRLKCFNGSSITNYGVAKFQCKRKESVFMLKFHVVDVEHKPLLSEKACVALGFIKYCDIVTCENEEITKLMREYQDVFEGYGTLPGQVTLELDENVPACIQPARRIPVCLKEKLKNELEKLEADNIIVKEKQHTEWVNNVLIVSKDKKFRICLDPIPLNKALKRPHFQFTTLDEMLPELKNAKVFSTVDAKKGFWQCQLTEKSSKLTTFWTPFGRYRWLRLPFGLASSPEIFQQRLVSLLKDLKGIEIIADDILIYGVGDSIEEATIDHNKKFKKLLQRLREVNCKLNKDKVNLLKTSVKFYGHVLTNEGLKVDNSKVDAINKMPTPRNPKDVLRFLGMVGYLSKFINNLSTNAASLRNLTKKGVDFVWTEKEEKEFRHIKHLISNLPTLQYFDVNKEVVIECDSSEFGLGAALYQDNKVISFASRCLNQTEKRYAQIEKEMLAVVFACTRFNQYIAGSSKTIIKTDHRPLINIANKPLIEAPKRLQMMLLTLQKYNVQLQFIKGKENYVADTLSRAPILDDLQPYDLESKMKESKVFSLISKISSVKFLKISDNLLKKIMEETNRDKNLQMLKKFILEGFPKYASEWPESLKKFSSLSHELSISKDGLIFRNDQIVIPEILQTEMVNKVHVSHNGIASTLRLARSNIFWPSMSDDIKEFVKKCHTCASLSASQQRLPLKCHEVSIYPFQYVSMDVFSVGDRNYLVTVDHYSDFFELDRLAGLTAKEVIQVCKKNFARHGIPQRVVTDNATNFINEQFKMFARDWNFEHVTSSPHHPESNGKAEAAVKIAKRLVVLSLESNEDLWFSLLHQRNIPIEMDNTSPSQKLFARSTRTSLPCVLKHLKPKIVTGVSSNIKERKEKMKMKVDQRSKDLPRLKVGQSIVTQLQPEISKRWSYGIVTKIIDDRSYIVQVNGKDYRRNRIHIKPYVHWNRTGGIPYQESDTTVISEEQNYDNNAGFVINPVDPVLPDRESRESLINPTPVTASHPDPDMEQLEGARRSGRVRTSPEYLKDYITS